VLGDLIFRAGGFLAFSLAYVAVTWVGFWFIWRRIALERVPALIAGACIAVAAAAGVEVWGPRSQMISFALTCLTLYWVEAYLRDRNRHLYLLPLVMVAWANQSARRLRLRPGRGGARRVHRDRALAHLTTGRRPPPPIAPALGGAARQRNRRPGQSPHRRRLPGRHPDPDQRGTRRACLRRRIATDARRARAPATSR
jgi:hypothetical protein